MKRYLKNIIFFCLPFLFGAILIFTIDPFILFNNNFVVGETAKQNVSSKLNYSLWKWSDYLKEKKSKILLGDSRMANFDTEVIKELSGRDFKNMAFGGGTIPEIIETFWFCQKNSDLNEVYIGVNFSIYNEYSSLNRCLETKNIFNNKLLYFINQSTIKSTTYLLKDKFTNSKTDIERPNVNKEKFWDQQLNHTSRKVYETYKYPKVYYDSLLNITKYCQEKNIELKFIIFPIHSDLQNKIEVFGRNNDLIKFKKDLKGLGEVYDFHLNNDKNKNRDNFKDPFHYTQTYMRELILEVFQK